MSPGLSDLGRFSEPALLVLISLAGGPKHGYAMIDDIATIGGSRLGPGTLYGAIARLEKLGLIEPLLPTDRRRPYRLTTGGAAILRRELAGLQRLAAAGLTRMATS